MLLGGDEMGRTQGGNNNAYCQDNEISWFDWETVDTDLLSFTERLIQIQREHPVFQRRGWFKGRSARGVNDIAWFRPDGGQMSEQDWQEPHARAFAVFLNGDALQERDEDGRPVRDDSFVLLFNAHHEPLTFTMPDESFGTGWHLLIDTTAAREPETRTAQAGDTFEVQARSLLAFRRGDWRSTHVPYTWLPMDAVDGR
jgi:glycogen operon protein